MRPVLFVAALAVAAATAPQADLQRAKTKKPRDAYKGDGQAGLSKVLNQHSLRAESNARPCSEWTPKQLQAFMATILEHRSDVLQQIYEATKDRRQMLLQTLEEYSEHWGNLNRAVSKHPHLLEPQRESHCREAVMWWTHHLSNDKRSELRKQSISPPLLPEGPKTTCGRTEDHKDALQACVHIEKANSCDWCHSTQAAHDAHVPGTWPLDGLNYTNGPDDGNPHGWDRFRRCDQDQLPRCQLCEGVGGMAWADNNSDYIKTPCEIVAKPSEVNMSTVAPPVYPKKFTVKRKDGKKGGYSDTLIGWEVMNSCFSFFPQNDSHGPLCYRSEEGLVKYYDISREAARTDYTLRLPGLPPSVPNTSSMILQVGKQMWIVNDLASAGNMQCVCTNPSGQHCTNNPPGKPCYSYVWHWDTFITSQYLGREKIGVEWIQDHGVGNSSKIMELDHFILWSHHIWTDPVSRRLIRAWKPFNGLQVYDPEAWLDDIEDPSVLNSPPEICKKPPPGKDVWRINCDDDGNYNGTWKSESEFQQTFAQQFEEMKAKVLQQFQVQEEIVV